MLVISLEGNMEDALAERDRDDPASSKDGERSECFIDADERDLVKEEDSPEDEPKLASVPGRAFSAGSRRM